MNKWVVAGAAAGLVAASVVTLIAVQRAREEDALAKIPGMISECFERIQQLEAELGDREPARASR